MTTLLLLDPDDLSRAAAGAPFEQRGDTVLDATSIDVARELIATQRADVALVSTRQVPRNPFSTAPASSDVSATSRIVEQIADALGDAPVPIVVICSVSVDDAQKSALYRAGASAIVPAGEFASILDLVDAQLRWQGRLRDASTACTRLRQDHRQLEQRLGNWLEDALSGSASAAEALLNESIAARPDGALLLDAEGQILEADAGAERLFSARLVGESLQSFVPSSCWGLFDHAYAHGSRRIVFDVVGNPPSLANSEPARRLAASISSFAAGDLAGGASGGAASHRLVLLIDLGRRQRVERMLDAADSEALPRGYHRRLADDVRGQFSIDALPRRSPAARTLHGAMVAASRELTPVLLRGETHVDCARYARMLHCSRNPVGPFVEVSCDGLGVDSQEIELFGERSSGSRPRIPGAVAMADSGTLLLHEVGKLSTACQERLLLVARDRHVRLMATTQRVSERLERSLIPQLALELTARMIEIPHLVEMRLDLPVVIADALGAEAYSRLSEDVRRALVAWHWPRDRAELEDELDRLRSIRGPRIELGDLSGAISSAFARSPDAGRAAGSEALAEPEARAEFAPYTLPLGGGAASTGDPGADGVMEHARPAGSTQWVPSAVDYEITEADPIDLDHYQKKAILRALSAADGNRTRAAAVLGVGKSTFYRKLSKLGLR